MVRILDFVSLAFLKIQFPIIQKPRHYITLISTPTPAGIFTDWRSSSVFGVGSITSIRRLWRRISNCSRASLLTKVERLSVIFSIFVGSGTGPTTIAPLSFAVVTILVTASSTSLCSKALIIIRIFPRALEVFLAVIDFKEWGSKMLMTYEKSLSHKHMNIQNYARTFATTPDPTVRPPSRIANRRPWSIAIGAPSSIVIWILSPGITISTPAGSSIEPVTSVVRK